MLEYLCKYVFPSQSDLIFIKYQDDQERVTVTSSSAIVKLEYSLLKKKSNSLDYPYPEVYVNV